MSILDIAKWNILGIIRFCWGLTKRETIEVYAHLQNTNDETTPNIKEESVTSSICACVCYVRVKQYVCVCVYVCVFLFLFKKRIKKIKIKT